MQLAAGVFLGIGASCLGSQIFRSHPISLVVFLGCALFAGALIVLSDAAGKQKPDHYRATALATLDFVETEVQELQGLLDAGFTNRLAERGVREQVHAYQAVAERIRLGLDIPLTEGGRN